MQFLDEVTIDVKAGDGGAGSRHFRREKFVPQGGPDGGDGGNGGSVILEADTSKQTLLDFKFKPRWQAQDGGKGAGSTKTGKTGEDLIVKVPVGTQVFNDTTRELVCDLDEHGMQFVIARGGRGGKGNNFFKSPTNRTPEHAQPGEPGQEGRYFFSLKLVAHVGLIGFPNAGKSTLISRISAAKPKIADYPFTTLVPNLGVVSLGPNRNFVVADIPGLIPGASDGKGLGIQFLKHVERTKVLIHLIDVNALVKDIEDGEPKRSFQEIMTELKNYSDAVSKRPMFLAVTKMDTAPEGYDPKKTESYFKDEVLHVHHISSASGAGIDALLIDLEKTVSSVSTV